MRIRGLLIAIMAIFLAGFVLSVRVVVQEDAPQIDMVALNEVVKRIESSWGQINEGDYSTYKQPFTVIDSSGDVLYQTGSADGFDGSIHDAIRNRDTIIDLVVQGNHVGKLIIHHQEAETVQQMKRQLMTTLMLTFISLAILSILYIIYLNKAVFQPFAKLQNFASHVARGVLDVPLDMDKHNRFGAFTESFDLMREELAAARRREYDANRSKKELVASLSHDIKTPIASIKAVTELMLLQATDDKVIKQLNTVYAKADQVNYLVTDMFHATLEELQELKVTITEESSTVLTDLIENVNYDNRIQRGPIPSCIILVDIMRLQQVLDNVLSNSYKYAATSVSIASRIDDTHLELYIMDYGKGISEEELPLVFNKFYRGTNADGKSGSGLGLYLSKYFMERMQGDIDCYNRTDGFTVVLRMKLAS